MLGNTLPCCLVFELNCKHWNLTYLQKSFKRPYVRYFFEVKRKKTECVLEKMHIVALCKTWPWIYPRYSKYSKFESDQIEYWNSKFKYVRIGYSSIPRRTWHFQILFLIFEDSDKRTAWSLLRKKYTVCISNGTNITNQLQLYLTFDFDSNE